MIAICTDITRIKEVESAGRKMRATFFSSVAHELRTPLNSIIPILKMVLDMLADNPFKDKFLNLLKVVLNSAIHLEMVIEDALDITRLENNKFIIVKEFFDIRRAVKDVCDIMEFQIEGKKLKLELTISDSVPERVFSD